MSVNKYWCEGCRHVTSGIPQPDGPPVCCRCRGPLIGVNHCITCTTQSSLPSCLNCRTPIHVTVVQEGVIH